MRYRRVLVWVATFGLVLAVLGASTAGCGGADDPARPLTEKDGPPRPTYNRFIRPDTGEFWDSYGAWDNRKIPDEEKAKSPWYNPRWAPFSKCMAGAGFETRRDRSVPFAQADLDRVVAQVNAARPDHVAKKAIGQNVKVGGVAESFLVCADTWLTLPTEELAANGLRQLEPGEVPQPYTDPAELPPPAFNNWIRPDTGEFWVPRVWDDRTLPEEEKAKSPWYNPRWAPFSKCMAGGGFETRKDRALPFAQADLDELVRQVNAARPDAEANKSVSNGAKLSGIAGSFLICADRWLALPIEELAANGLRQLGPGEVPEP